MQSSSGGPAVHFAPTETVTQDNILRFFSEVTKLNSTEMFREPVDATAVEGYYDQVMDPVDLRTLRSAVETWRGPVKGLIGFVEERLVKMFANARDYNEGTKYYAKALRAEEDVASLWLEQPFPVGIAQEAGGMRPDASKQDKLASGRRRSARATAGTRESKRRRSGQN